jgi:phosphate transport system substrate-binding protein
MTRMRWLIVSLFALMLSSCSGKPSKPDALQLNGAGATFPAILYHHWFEQYDRDHPEASVNYKAIGSGEGVERFLAEKVDFAASDNGLSDAEVKQVKRGVIQVPVAAGMVVLAYNLPGIDNLQLSREAYAGIFLGSIRKWDDEPIQKCNPKVKLPPREITLVVRLDKSGTTYLFSNHLSAAWPEWRSTKGTGRDIDWPSFAIRKSGNEGVGGTIKNTLGAIGYVELGTALDGRLQMAALKNKAGEYVKPSVKAAHVALDRVGKAALTPSKSLRVLRDPTQEEAYPITGFTYLLLYRKHEDEKKHQALQQLVTWCLSAEAQQKCEELGYVPLTDAVAAEARKAVLDSNAASVQVPDPR